MKPELFKAYIPKQKDVHIRDMSVISVNQSACSLFVYTALDSIYIDFDWTMKNIEYFTNYIKPHENSTLTFQITYTLQLTAHPFKLK